MPLTGMSSGPLNVGISIPLAHLFLRMQIISSIIQVAESSRPRVHVDHPTCSFDAGSLGLIKARSVQVPTNQEDV
jgi:hypothetical protein